MKKNKILRFAAILMVMTLLSTCAISGTFAKYTTSGELEAQTARVAKWGVKVTAAAGDGLFAEAYNNVATVSGKATTIAPGTEDNLAAAIAVTGSPEVAVSITYAADVQLEGWTINSTEFYCPVVFKVQFGSEEAVEIKQSETIKSIDDLEKAIKDAIEAKNATSIAAGTNLAESAPSLTLSWAWAIGSTDTENQKDTALGDVIASGTESTISIAISVTVAQVD